MRKTHLSRLFIILLGTTLLLMSCNMPANKTATPDAKAVITEAAVTVAAQLTLSAKLTPSPTPTLLIVAKDTPLPPAPTIENATPLPAPTTTVKATSGSSSSGDLASFVADVTVPDGTSALPGAVFEKTWRIKNTGTTTWSPAYTLVWVEGDKMGSPESVAIPGNVRPGETIDISVKLTAPSKAGTYQTYFRLRNESGQFFKLDGTGDLWVKIIVGLTPTSTLDSEAPTPTATSPTATPDK
jgi:hypothetical protein